MPIIKSAKKRVRVTKKASVRNAKTKRALRQALKNLQVVSLDKDAKKAGAALSEAQSAIDQAVKKGVMHKNKAARKKSQLAAQAKAAGVKLPKTAPKTAAKKPAAKKSTAKTK